MGGGQFTVSEGVFVGHILRDEFGKHINHEEFILSASISSNLLVEIGAVNLTINTTNNTGDVVNSVVVDWAIEYTNNNVFGESLVTQVRINETDCTILPRFVGATSAGSTGGSCLLNNVSNGAVINVKIFGNGTNADFTGTVFVKNFFNHIQQSSQVNLSGLNVTTTSFSKIANVSIDNVDHAQANIYIKAGISATDSAGDINFFFRLVNAVGVNGSIISRTMGGEVGVLILQDAFSNLSQDNYSVELWGSCDVPDCLIVGGGHDSLYY